MVAVLFVPALLMLVPLVRPSARSRMVAAVVLSGAAVIAIASVGMLLMPTLIVAWLAVAAERSDDPATAPAI